MEALHLKFTPHTNRCAVAEKLKDMTELTPCSKLHFGSQSNLLLFTTLNNKSAAVFQNRAHTLTDTDPIKCFIYWLSINSVSYLTPMTFFDSQSHIPIEQMPQKYLLCIKKEKTAPFQLPWCHNPVASNGKSELSTSLFHPESPLL